MSRELDAEVAEKVMGWRRVQGATWWLNDEGVERLSPPTYSTDISAAMEVVEKMCERGFVVGLNRGAGTYIGQPIPKTWEVDFGNGRMFEASSESLPEAICHAALKAVEAKK